MLILGIDTALAACSVAAIEAGDGSRTLARCHREMQRGHAELVGGMVRAVIAEAGIRSGDLQRIAVTTGPGTFTGVRIGLAMARGLALGLEAPAFGVTTLEAIAHNVEENPERRPIVVAIDARRGEVYWQAFTAGHEEIDEPAVISLEDAADRLPERALLAGSAARLLVARHPELRVAKAHELPDAAVVARLAAHRPLPASPPAPLYLRAPDAKAQKAVVALAPVQVRIVDASPAHAGLLADIHREGFADGWSTPDLAALIGAPGNLALVAVAPEADDPLGFVLAREAADEAEILTITVRPAARRRKVGQRLVEALLNRLRTAGTQSLFLEVAADNEAAQALYLESGFRRVGTRCGYYRRTGGARVDALILRRQIG